MSDMSNDNDALMETFVYESNRLLDKLEEILLAAEKSALSEENINEIFRIMHTIKGSAAMMMFDKMSKVAHSVEDLFFFIREKKPQKLDYEDVCNLVLQALDYMRSEIEKIQSGEKPDADNAELCREISNRLKKLKEENESPQEEKANKSAARQRKAPAAGTPLPDGMLRYRADVFFEPGCEMENVRAFMLVSSLKGLCSQILCRPGDLEENGSESIIKDGFPFLFVADDGLETIEDTIRNSLFVQSYKLKAFQGSEEASEGFTPCFAQTEECPEQPVHAAPGPEAAALEQCAASESAVHKEVPGAQEKTHSIRSMISVDTGKLDSLMNLVGEIVTVESMVIKSPDLKDLALDNFEKSARQLRKLTDDLQDIVMSIRMVPISPVFHRMNRIVRDMEKSLNKKVDLEFVGEETEVDKNIVDELSDPMMHLVRNCMDHGIEASAEERVKKGKPPAGKITLKAQDTGGDILITVSDDGCGLDRDKILSKAKSLGLVNKPESLLTDNEIFSYILLPGFTTNKEVTKYSGRGVGMDVVRENVEKVGGSIEIKSAAGKGSSFIIHIPLTLAIIDGMEIAVGKSVYAIPIVSIKRSFKTDKESIIANDGTDNEMIMVRGNCYPVIRLHRIYGIEAQAADLCDGIMIMVESNGRTACLFADRLLGEQQIVVKSMPYYLNRFDGKKCGIGGCTILGDGSISLIINVSDLIENIIQ